MLGTAKNCANKVVKCMHSIFKHTEVSVTSCLTRCFARVLVRLSRVRPCLIFDDSVLFHGTILHEDYRHRFLCFRVAELAPKYHVWLSAARQVKLFSQIKQYISRIVSAADQCISPNGVASTEYVRPPQRNTICIGRFAATATLYAPDDDFRKSYLEVIQLVLCVLSRHVVLGALRQHAQNYPNHAQGAVSPGQFTYEATRTYWGLFSKIIHLLVADIRGGLIFRNPARCALLTEISNDLVTAQDRYAAIDLDRVVQEIFDEMYRREDYRVAHRVGTRQESFTICPYYPNDNDPEGGFNVVR